MKLKPTPAMDLAELKILARLQAAAVCKAYRRGEPAKAGRLAVGLKRTVDEIERVERFIQ